MLLIKTVQFYKKKRSFAREKLFLFCSCERIFKCWNCGKVLKTKKVAKFRVLATFLVNI